MSAFPSVSQLSGGNAVYEKYYQQVDPLNTGSVGPEEAVDFLKKSGLPDSTLRQIWDLADPDGMGFLDEQGFFLALRLVAAAQSGHEVSLSSLEVPLAPPTFRDTPSPSTAPPSGSAPWAVTAKEKLKFDGVFDSLSPVNGLLSGDQVKPMLLKSNLPRDVLGKVWELSDIDQDGHLDRDEFAVAMHLVHSSLEQEVLPPSLPASLVPPSKRKKSGAVLPGSVAVLPSSAPPPKDSLRWSPPLVIADSLPSSRSLSPEPPPAPQAVSWVIPAADRSRYDDLFLQTDTDLDGLVSGTQVKEIFMRSGLPQSLLAHIWALSDTRQVGQLTKEQFSLAMHLVQQKVRHGADPPQTLSPDMVPPSERGSRLTDGVRSTELTGIEELDDIGREIAELQREKLLLAQEVRDQQEALRLKSRKVQEAQEDLEREAGGLRQLEAQKRDAQERLDEMNEQKAKLEAMLSDVREKVQEESRTVSSLHSQIRSQEAELRGQEAELERARAELELLQREEARLEQSVRSGRARLETTNGSLRVTQDAIDEVRKNLSRIQQRQEETSRSIERYGSILNDADRGNTAALEELSLDSDLVASHDPFGTKDLTSDPFQTEDPFKSDPFEDAFGDDPFKGSDPFRTSTAKDFFGKLDTTEPFSTPDRFGRSASVSTVTVFGGGVSTATADPFATHESFRSSSSTNFSRVPKGDKPLGKRPQSLVLPPKKGPPPRPAPPSSWK
ncbi:epidermal growth factor receptor substrate 15-like 1 [Scleropages formosus]|uniref:epidermal growth factor receptor substrate 15-like 1 n=1 Tax=Scleropages formosus TaxID=113540 RepID=UPI0010FAC585|nr:epidermal growth factor receptor substrate 15-like 1 [Scleropages formosus]